MIYVAITYPKHIGKSADYRDFHIYAKQTSNKEKMVEYGRELMERHGKTHIVRIVSRERAKMLKERWGNMIIARDRLLLAQYSAQFN